MCAHASELGWHGSVVTDYKTRMLWSILALGALAAGGAWWWTSRPPAPRTPPVPQGHGEQDVLFLQLDGDLVVVEGSWTLTTTEQATTLVVHAPVQTGLDHPIELTIVRTAVDDTVNGSVGGHPVRFGGMLDPVEMTVERDTGSLTTSGLQVALLESLSGPFVRETRLVVTLLGELGHPIGAAFSDTDGVELPAVPWTLDGATRFTEKTLIEKGWAKDVRIAAPGVLEVVYPDDTEAQLQLHNIFPMLQSTDPTEGQQRLVAHLKSTVDGLKARSDTGREQLMVRVYAGPSPFTLSLPHHEPVAFASVPLAVDLTAVFVQDTATSMRPLRDEEVAALEPDPSAWLDLAKANLLRSLPEIRIVGSGSVFMVTAGGDYENALVLLPELWAVVEPLLDGPPLVAIPARDLLFITGDIGPVSVEVLTGLVHNAGDLSYPISPGVYRVVDQGQTLERIS